MEVNEVARKEAPKKCAQKTTLKLTLPTAKLIDRVILPAQAQATPG